MTDPITDERLKEIMNTLDNLYALLNKRIIYGQSMEVQDKRSLRVETIIMGNAQAHIREAAVLIGRIILNRVAPK